jgi:hypothetical protein
LKMSVSPTDEGQMPSAKNSKSDQFLQCESAVAYFLAAYLREMKRAF